MGVYQRVNANGTKIVEGEITSYKDYLLCLEKGIDKESSIKIMSAFYEKDDGKKARKYFEKLLKDKSCISYKEKLESTLSKMDND